MAIKSDVVFALENAGWPALLVNEACSIVRANHAAVKLFGTALEGAAPLLSSIWAHENGVPAEQYLAQWERSPASINALRFRIICGTINTFPVSLCALHRDGQKFFVFQFQPEPAPTSGLGNTEFTLAHKQKLDCALQLAR